MAKQMKDKHGAPITLWEIGDVVQLKIGGPAMIVCGSRVNKGKLLLVRCRWITAEGVPYFVDFPFQVLQKHPG